MALRDWLYLVSEPRHSDAGWTFEVRTARVRLYGPFIDEAAARGARLALFRRFNRSARAHGGWAWRSTAGRWVVTLPPDVPARGMPLQHAPCTQHAE